MSAEHLDNGIKDNANEDQNKIRKKMRNALFEEFCALHGRIIEAARDRHLDNKDLQCLVTSQISLSQQIIRETRSLNGESIYLH